LYTEKYCANSILAQVLKLFVALLKTKSTALFHKQSGSKDTEAISNSPKFRVSDQKTFKNGAKKSQRVKMDVENTITIAI